MITVNNLWIYACDRSLRHQNCNSYKDVLPRGQCSDVLSKYNIYNNASTNLKNTDKVLKIVFSKVVAWNKAANNTKDVAISTSLQKHLVACTNLPKFKENLENTIEVYKKNISDFYNCFSFDTKWLICHLTHSVCLQSSVDTSVILSPPCKSTCEEDKCFTYFNYIYNMLKDLNKICPTAIPPFTTNQFIPNCQVLPAENMSYFERCQRKEIQDIRYTAYCYNYTLKQDSYIGKQLFQNRQGCVFWSEANPFISASVYPFLVNNFCRNPQGYASAPWCYTDMKSRSWEICKIEDCSKRQERYMSNGKLITIFYL